MKNCLLIGGGSKFGHYLTQEFVNAGYTVYLLTGTSGKPKDNVVEILINWDTFSVSDLGPVMARVPNLDVIFFNHNSSSLSADMFKSNTMQSIKDWQHSYFVACQMPFYLVQLLNKKISNNTKIGWMLSQLIVDPTDKDIGYADYIGNKFTNACIMRAFSIYHSGCFFGIHPDGIDTSDTDSTKNKANDIVKLIDNSSKELLNGEIFSAQGEKLALWKNRN